TIASDAEPEHVHRRRSVALDTPEVPYAGLGILDGLEMPVKLDGARRNDLDNEQDLARIDPYGSTRARRAAHHNVGAATRTADPDAGSGEDPARMSTGHQPRAESNDHLCVLIVG